jgi:ribonuclease HIII
MRFHLAAEQWERIYAQLIQLEEGHVSQQRCTDTTQHWRLEIKQAQERVVATLYTTGTLLVQGKASPLFESVCATVETLLGSSFAERGARYVPEMQREIILHHLNQPARQQQAHTYAEQQLGQQLYAFLSQADRDTYLAAAGALLSLQTTQTALPDYSLLVMPFARVYEGFLLQLASRLDPLALSKKTAALKRGQAGMALTTLSQHLQHSDKQQADKLKGLLYATWRGIRNKVMHAQGQETDAYRYLQAALHDIEAIHLAMREGYAYALRNGFIGSSSRGQGASPRKQETHDRQATETPPPDHREEEQRKHRKASSRDEARPMNDDRKLSLNRHSAIHARIGIDESGKGDYFGPLVIAAVYVDAQTETELKALGVRDSKRLKDDQMRSMAEVIKHRCQHAVVAIPPKRYNELYTTMHHLNRMLAWGHARALENLLEQVDCPVAIADQFGDASFLRNALLQKGRRIQLQQRPRAEDDLAVAAASILARVEFVRRLESLGRQIGRILPKGASSPAIGTTGRAIVAQGGKQALATVAKLHFKTTTSIMANMEEAP